MSPPPKKCPLKFVSGHLSCHADVVTPDAYHVEARRHLEVSVTLECLATRVLTVRDGLKTESLIDLSGQAFGDVDNGPPAANFITYLDHAAYHFRGVKQFSHSLLQKHGYLRGYRRPPMIYA